MKRLFLILAILATAPSFAALSPLRQSVREIKTILASPKLATALGENEQIEQIEHFDNGYFILTNNMQMFVEVKYLKEARVGPRQFQLNFQNPTPIVVGAK